MDAQVNLLDVIKTLADVLIPITIFVLGSRFTKQREITDAREKYLEQVSNLSESLASENRKKRLIALQILSHLKQTGELPSELLTAIGGIAASDDPEMAGAALVILGEEKLPDSVLLLELYAPLKMHFERTKDAFNNWKGFDESLENEIMQSNKFVRDLLIKKWHMIPGDLRAEAQNLIEHYNAWLDEYNRVRPNGIRDKKESFVFVGDKGFPFPVQAEKIFIEQYNRLLAKNAP